MNKQTAKKDLLWQAYERSGLWEAAWSVQTVAPDLWGEPAIVLARSILKDLLLQGLVFVYRLDDDTGEERPIPEQEAIQLVKEPNSWVPPSSPKNQIWFGITEKGEKTLRKLEAAHSA